MKITVTKADAKKAGECYTKYKNCLLTTAVVRQFPDATPHALSMELFGMHYFYSGVANAKAIKFHFTDRPEALRKFKPFSFEAKRIK